MDKKIALVYLIENSLMISDQAKKQLLLKLKTLSDEQVYVLGKFLSREQELLLENKETILTKTKLLLDTLQVVTTKK